MIRKSAIWLHRIAWSLLVAVLVLTAVYVSIGRYVVEYIDDYQDFLLQKFVTYSGFPLKAERLYGEWSKLSPVITLEQVSLAAPDSEDKVVKVDSLSFQIAPIRSLLNQTVSIKKLVVNGLTTALQEVEPGQWQLNGYPASRGDDSTPGNIDSVFDLLLSVRGAELTQANLTLNFHNNKSARLAVKELSLLHGDNFRRARLEVVVDDQREPIAAIIEAQGDPRDHEDFSARAYLKLDAINFSSYLPVIQPLGIELQQAVIDSELWLDWRPGVEITAQGFLKVPHLDLAALSGETLKPLHDLEVQFRAEKNRQSDWQVWLPAVQTRWQDELFEFSQLQLSWSGNEIRWAMPMLSVDQLKQHLLEVNLLAESEQTLIEKLSPSGTLHNLHVSYFLADENDREQDAEPPPRFSLRANLQSGAIKPWYGAPGASGVDGYIEAQPLSGMVELDSHNLALDFPHVYKHSLTFDSAQAQVAWQITDSAVTVKSGPIILQGEHGPASGLLSLDLPLHKGEGTPLMDLTIGIRNTDAKYRNLFIPYFLNEQFLDWMNGSVPAGRVVEGGFIYRGSLLNGDALNRTVQLFFNIDQTTLEFHSDWPKLTDIKGLVLIDDGAVFVETEQAKMFNLDVDPAVVTVDPIDDGMWLNVNAKAQGNAFGALNVVNNSMIDRLVDGAFQSWRMTGDVAASVDLGVPLAGSERAAEIDVKVDLADTQLEIPDVRVQLESVSGELRYQSQEGISSNNLKANLYGRPLSISVSQHKDQSVDVDLAGSIDIDDVAMWSQQPALTFASGTTDVKANVHIAPKTDAEKANNQVSEFSVTSSLKGITLDLPEPYAKTAEESWSFYLRQPLVGDVQMLTMGIEQRARLQFQFKQGQVDSGLLTLGEGVRGEHFPGLLTVTGQVDRFSLEEWQPVLTRYLQQEAAFREESQGAERASESVAEIESESPQIHSQGSTDTAVAMTESVQAGPALKIAASRLLIENVYGMGQQFEDCTVDLVQQEDGWWLSVLSPMFDGEMFLPNAQTPLSLRLDRLSFPATTTTTADSEESSPLSELSLSDLDEFSAYIAIANLEIGDESLGSINFLLNTQPGHLELANLGGYIHGIRIGINSPGHLDWRDTPSGSQSQFKADFDFSDIGDVLDAWNYERFIESDYGRGSLDLSWSGRPDEWQLATSQGPIYLRLDEGRFLKASETASGTLKVVGIVNLMNIVRRLRLDFSDVYKKGISYDRVEGRARLQDQQLIFTDELVVNSPSSRFHLRGNADLASKQLNMELITTLPVANNLPWVAALAGGLPTAAGVYVASKIFEKEMDRLSSAIYTVEGDWNEPELKFKRVFDNTDIKKSASQEPATETRGDSAESLPSDEPKSSEVQAAEDNPSPAGDKISADDEAESGSELSPDEKPADQSPSIEEPST